VKLVIVVTQQDWHGRSYVTSWIDRRKTATVNEQLFSAQTIPGCAPGFAGAERCRPAAAAFGGWDAVGTK